MYVVTSGKQYHPTPMPRFIPLNGGSDTRRDAREYWQQQCKAAGVAYTAHAFGIYIVGAIPRNNRGWRYVNLGLSARWLHWRKAKSLTRRTRHES